MQRIKLAIAKDSKSGDIVYELVSATGWHERLSRDELFDFLLQATSGLRHEKTVFEKAQI